VHPKGLHLTVFLHERDRILSKVKHIHTSVTIACGTHPPIVFRARKYLMPRIIDEIFFQKMEKYQENHL
jgi:hypothetical protein